MGSMIKTEVADIGNDSDVVKLISMPYIILLNICLKRCASITMKLKPAL